MNFTKTTEQDSNYDHLEKMSINELLRNINTEDKSVPDAVEKEIPQIERLVEQVVKKLKNGGRLFYIGAGTSGRLGILDASECPPTFGVPFELVIGIIAGGDVAIRKAVENAEDSTIQGWIDLQEFQVSDKDVVVGIAASGTTPYVISALEKCNENNIVTGCITCNKNSPLALTAKYPIEVVVGPEFVTGSSRMKAGTAQKLVLNMITTTTMIQLGKVKGNKMVDMQLSNNKLVDRGLNMLMKELNIDKSEAEALIEKYGNVRNAINNYNQETDNGHLVN
ncbi:N-acetylmuramic acid 6-phosphate etherase [Aureibaculum marinum]|uniref:N-acetylmuramic acid 6-phosphate etherase n=1 Tax=Aureibaculum marinum TaxID=2487930 RepID=A0A3N4P197_9FLAO|nr:N-acetylmuramic acid 6-phosphate etherase [Aureibaculum marinum]RPE00928.1 N-acetylmuramic acid 6-phosphate etherase [Aureibaculum marinum]